MHSLSQALVQGSKCPSSIFTMLLIEFFFYFDSLSSCSLWCSYLQSDSSKDFQRHIIDMLEDAEVVSTMLIPGAYTQTTVAQHSLPNSPSAGEAGIKICPGCSHVKNQEQRYLTWEKKKKTISICCPDAITSTQSQTHGRAAWIAATTIVTFAFHLVYWSAT